MNQRVRTILITVLATLVLLIAGGFIFLYSGVYSVGATTEHGGLTQWALNTAQERSVSTRAENVTGEPPTDSAALHHGFIHFHAMCVQCHGAPGLDRGELGKGMNPTPPRLEEKASDWTDAELFWITKHGIRLAGMPAFGPTHGDDELWGIVGFVRQVETMTEEEYGELLRAQQARREGGEGEGGEAGGHTHAPGTPDHEH